MYCMPLIIVANTCATTLQIWFGQSNNQHRPSCSIQKIAFEEEYVMQFANYISHRNKPTIVAQNHTGVIVTSYAAYATAIHLDYIY